MIPAMAVGSCGSVSCIESMMGPRLFRVTIKERQYNLPNNVELASQERKGGIPSTWMGASVQ